MKKIFMAIALIAAVAYTNNSQAFFGLFGCDSCTEEVTTEPSCSTCNEVAYTEVVEMAPPMDMCSTC